MTGLHLICGTCGCNDQWEWSYDPQGRDVTDLGGVHPDACGMDMEDRPPSKPTFEPDVYLHCRNCSEVISLSDFATQRK